MTLADLGRCFSTLLLDVLGEDVGDGVGDDLGGKLLWKILASKTIASMLSSVDGVQMSTFWVAVMGTMSRSIFTIRR